MSDLLFILAIIGGIAVGGLVIFIVCTVFDFSTISSRYYRDRKEMREAMFAMQDDLLTLKTTLEILSKGKR